MRGMIAERGRDQFGREPYPSKSKGPRARAGNARCQPARSRVPANWVSELRSSDEDAVVDAHGRVWRPDIGAAVRLVKLCKEKARGCFCGADSRDVSR
jgi:hypothetical protein